MLILQLIKLRLHVQIHTTARGGARTQKHGAEPQPLCTELCNTGSVNQSAAAATSAQGPDFTQVAKGRVFFCGALTFILKKVCFPEFQSPNLAHKERLFSSKQGGSPKHILNQK